MKKFIVWAIALGLAFCHIQGMCALGSGIKCGMSFSNLKDDNSPGMELGFLIGSFLRIDMNDNFAIQPEVYYTPKFSIVGNSLVKLKINYIEIPVLLKYKLASKGAFRPSLFTGPYAALKLDVRDMISEEYGEWNIRGMDFGIIIGADMKLYIDGVGMILDFRYSWGLTKIYSDFDSKNSTFTIMAGFQFN